MIHLKKIVLPVDFSARSAMAASQARLLAQQFGSLVMLVNVQRPFQVAAEGVDVPATSLLNWFDEQKPILEQQLQEFACTYLKGVSTRCYVSEGDPGSEIIRTATTEQADLILLPTHGHGSFRRLILGSVTAKVLHDSPVPVLTSAHVDTLPEEGKPIRRILVAVDMEEQTKRLMGIGSHLASELQAELHVVHARPDDGTGILHFAEPAWRPNLAQRPQAALDDPPPEL